MTQLEAALPYELAAPRRAVAVELGEGTIRPCSAADLVVHKLASERVRGAADVEGIIMRQTGRLDRSCLEPLVGQLTTALDRPEIVEFFAKALARAGVCGHG